MTVYSGKVTLAVGAASPGTVISNLKRINWRRVTEVKPRTDMSAIVPVGWHQSHKHVVGEIHVLSEAHDAFVNYLKEIIDNVEIPFAVATIVDMAEDQRIATFTGMLLLGCDESFIDGEDSVFVYRFVAKKVVEIRGIFARGLVVATGSAIVAAL